MSIRRRKKKRRKLVVELILASGISLVLALSLSNCAEELAYTYIYDWLSRQGYYERRLDESLKSLQEYIDEKQVTSGNVELLLDWVDGQKDIYAMFYKDVDLLFGPYLVEGDFGTEEYYKPPYYEMTLCDGTPIKAELECFMDSSYYYGVSALRLTVGCVCFIVFLFVYLHGKIRYINRLEQELRILGSGNLEYSITVKGNDEVSGLAEGIESMRNGILEQQRMKAEAERANTELVTAMSHDLRTPLTSLIGYLELLTMHRYDSEEQMQKHLAHCREKAFQIKRMSDRLFEYFLVYGKQERNYQLHPVPCMDLLEELCNGQFFDWQEQGGAVDCQIEPLKETVRIDNEYFQRVLDNLVSNLKKYGDVAKPLTICAFGRQDMLHILFTNHVREQKDRIESTRIGLRTCGKIMEKHGGGFVWKQEGDSFTVELTLPFAKE